MKSGRALITLHTVSQQAVERKDEAPTKGRVGSPRTCFGIFKANRWHEKPEVPLAARSKTFFNNQLMIYISVL